MNSSSVAFPSDAVHSDDVPSVAFSADAVHSDDVPSVAFSADAVHSDDAPSVVTYTHTLDSPRYIWLDDHKCTITTLVIVFDDRTSDTCDTEYGTNSPVMRLRGNKKFLQKHLGEQGIRWE
jgi:hypothetical protein